MRPRNDFSSNHHETMWRMKNGTLRSPKCPHCNGVVHHSQPWALDYKNIDKEMESEQKEDMIEYMFEKALTPSDIGKLYRLMIPKQHALKKFPPIPDYLLERGVLQSFEDESGKLWTFRYIYWKTSQSYVLTTGWRDYVKEKQLDAGDVVSFLRQRPDGQQLYIRCKHSSAAAAAAVHDSRLSHTSLAPTSTSSSSPGGSRVYHSAHSAYPSHQHHHTIHVPTNHEAAPPVVQTPAPEKNKVRLFGVNIN